MAKPRVFVSSTYYDLKHVRGSLDIFFDTLGFEGILSEKGNIPYTPFEPLDESCYREVSNVDIFVLIIGGRYGTPASDQEELTETNFYIKYDSITKREYDEAVKRDIPIYILIESSVYSEYRTYLKNKDNKDIEYAHVDSVNIFELIKDILSKPRNNPMKTFEKASDIETWLKEQWTGLFKELLQRKSRQSELITLSAQVAELKETNSTLKKYLESVLTGQNKDDAIKLIESEKDRLKEVEKREKLSQIEFYKYVSPKYNFKIDDFIEVLTTSQSIQEFADKVAQIVGDTELGKSILSAIRQRPELINDINDARNILNLPAYAAPKKKVGKKKTPRVV